MKDVCVICGALFEDGKGFVEEHLSPCANERYGWAFTMEVPDDWDREGVERELAMFLYGGGEEGFKGLTHLMEEGL